MFHFDFCLVLYKESSPKEDPYNTADRSYSIPAVTMNYILMQHFHFSVCFDNSALNKYKTTH